MKLSTFYIAKMDCPTEEQLIRNRFRTIEGVEELRFDLMNRRLTVTHELDDDRSILSALETLGMEPELLTPEIEAPQGAGERAAPASQVSAWIAIGLAGAAAIAAEVVAWTTGREDSAVVIVLAAFAMLAGGRETFRKGLLAIRTRTININLLMTIAIVGALFIGQWPEAAMVTVLFGVAELIEGYSLDRARHAIRTLMELTPETATVQDERGQWRSMPAVEVRTGQVVRVKPGERIALDGLVRAGQTSVNQAPITGESIPVMKQVGDQVFAGTVNERGSFEFEVTANKGNTTLARIVRAVQQAQSERAPTQRFVDHFAQYYTPAVVVFALLVAGVPPLIFGQPYQPWLYKALVMLVIACPCALVISTPVTVVSGLASAARRGILVKGGAYLESGRRLRAIALDKTGTLTHGKPKVTDVITLAGQPEDELAQIAASLEVHSEHPVASAIVAHWTGADRSAAGTIDPGRLDAVERSREILPVEGFESITGRGAKGRVEGRLYYIGNHRLAEENGVCSPRVEAELARFEKEGKTTVVLTTETAALAVLGVADTLRETSIVAVRQLHEMGLRTVLLTGDNQVTAQAIAERVGIDDARGNLLPEDKLSAMGALLVTHGAVGMVGDGINDAPALAKSTIGFAMGAAGTDTALETADVALMQDDLRKLPEFVGLSRRTSRVLVQNIALSIGIKAVFFILALTGNATLWMAVFADMGASLLVVFNGLRLLTVKRP